MTAPLLSEATRLVERAFAQDGRQANDVKLVVLLGSRGGALVQALFDCAPNVSKVLVLEPDAQLAANVRELAAANVHELTSANASWAERVTIYGPAELQTAHEFVAAYLTIGQFLLGSQLPPSSLTCVVDAKTAETPVGRALQRAATDVTLGFSREFLRQVAGRPEFASVLYGIAQYFAAQGDHYHALKLYSSVAPQKMNAALVRGAFACLLALGNADLCEHWLRAMPLDEPSRQALREQIPPEANARGANAQTLLEQNLRFLEPHFPAAVATLRQTAPASNLFALELPAQPWLLKAFGQAATERRAYQLLVRAHGLTLTEENPLTDLGELNAAVVACAQQGQDHAWLGGLVKYAMFALNLLSRPSLLTLHGWQRVTFLQEQDSAALVRWLGAVDLRPWLDVAQVRLTVGADASADLVQGLVSNLDQAVPELGIGVATEAKRQVLQQRLQKLSRAPELFAALERRYQQHPERLRSVLHERSRPLKVLLMTSRYTTVLQHVTRDLAEGFEQLGHQVTVLCEARAGESMIAFCTAERLLELEPDFVFLLDHIRPEYAALLPSGMPVVTWVLDELPALKDPNAIATLGSLDLAYGFNGAVARLFRELGYPHVDQLPFAVNPARYVPEPPLADARGIAFTTHIGQFGQDPPNAPGLNALLAQRFDAEPEIPLEMFRIAPLLESALAELGLDASAEATRHLVYHGLQLARQQDRERVAQRIVRAGLPLTVYGLGWDSMPEFAAMAGGVVQPGPALRQVYRQHRAVLHINRGCNIHPRVLETMCSGGLVIARWDPLDEIPGETRDQLGDALSLFRNHDEMLALFQRAVYDDAFRNELIVRGQTRVLEQHTYQVRARKIIADLANLVEQHLQRATSTDAFGAPRSAHA